MLQVRSVPREFTLLSRPGCHLCEEFEQELLAHFGPDAIRLQHAQVDQRLDWLVEYGRRIPVLLDASGQAVCEVRLDPEAVRRALRAPDPRNKC